VLLFRYSQKGIQFILEAWLFRWLFCGAYDLSLESRLHLAKLCRSGSLLVLALVVACKHQYSLLQRHLILEGTNHRFKDVPLR
jgi:hypothetical protein